MNTVILQTELSPREIEQLIKEFPHYLFLNFKEEDIDLITPEQWAKVEIFFGNRLRRDQLKQAPLLRWVHSPNTNLKDLCLSEIADKKDILLSSTPEKHAVQSAEFVLGAILCFAKHLMHWRHMTQHPGILWEAKWPETVWSLQSKILIQVGLGPTGIEIARVSQQAGLKIWGADPTATFQPFCKKTFSLKELSAITPQAQIVCIDLERRFARSDWSPLEIIPKMQEDALLILLGWKGTPKADELHQALKGKKLRGVVIDCAAEEHMSAKSSLWSLPNLIVTPNVSALPRDTTNRAFKIFRYNLGQFAHGNIGEMHDLVEI